MRILITGAGGQIGGDLVHALARREHEIIATDVAVKPDRVEPAQNVTWHHLDVTDSSAVMALFHQVRPERVFHLAAILSARGEEIPQTTYRVNELGTFHVLEACRATGVGQLIFTSSIAVFGPDTHTETPTPDEAPRHPTTMYGVNKASGELLGSYYHKRYGFDFRSVRFPGLISAAMPGGGTSDYALFMYVDAVRIGAYEAFCRPDTVIPLMYMPDALRALIELSEAPESRLARRVYNIAAFSPRAEEIASSVGRRVPGAKITFRPDPRRQAILDSWPRILDDSNARREWGWKPEFDLEEMSDDLVPRIRDLLGATSK
ncbi:MAG TPA: NAD-dependent epimerase/dehydratase family protein [Kofleriaceae bacterium]|nr:NAD-dependent epimerase/dehydratase family protein [Kofleriaceae bacterium]